MSFILRSITLTKKIIIQISTIAIRKVIFLITIFIYIPNVITHCILNAMIFFVNYLIVGLRGLFSKITICKPKRRVIMFVYYFVYFRNVLFVFYFRSKVSAKQTQIDSIYLFTKFLFHLRCFV